MTRKKKLTVKFIENLKTDKKREEFCDTVTQGFGVRVTKQGTKSFFVRFRYKGKGKRVTLGKYPILSLAEARDKAVEVLMNASNGRLDLDEPNNLTVLEAHDLFIDLYAKVKNKDWKVSKSRLKKFIVEYGEYDLSDLQRRDIIKHLDQLMLAGTPIQSNRVHSALSRFLNWCVERDYIDQSPCAGVKKRAKENQRDRVLSDEELLKVWNVIDGFKYPFKPLFKLLILTAQRRAEVSGMRWSELDLKEKKWTIPKERAKNGKAHIVPLSPQVVSILQSVPYFLRSDYVFTTNGNTPVSGLGKYKYILDEKSGVTDWVFHDFRRTAASRMPKLQVPPYVVEKILNHISGTFSGVLGVYQQHGYDIEKREALNAWADYVMELYNGRRKNLHTC